jgi:hypothetical protein
MREVGVGADGHDQGYNSRYSLEGVKAATTAPQEALIAHARDVFTADERVVAAYLVGGFAVGQGDAWSDVDLQCLVRDDAEQEVASSWREIANAIAPTAYIQAFVGTTGGVCITPQWLHFDVVFHATSSVDPETVEGMVPLVDKAGLLPEGGIPRPSRKGEPFFPLSTVEMFLYMLGNMVSVIGRQELVPATNGVIIVRDIGLVGLLLAEQGWASTREHTFGNPFPFTKRLRTYLTEEQNELLLSLPALVPTIDSVIDGYLALARAFLPRARRLAAETGSTWPAAYEAASVSYFERSLGVKV